MKISGLIVMAFFVGLAVNVPMVLFGASRQTLLIVDFVLAGLWFLNQGKVVESIFEKLLIYGLVFSMWSILGLVIVVVLALLSFDMHLPSSAYVIACTGLFGVVREIFKSPAND